MKNERQIPMMGCEKIRIRLDDWLDGRLTDEALGEVKDHLAYCEACRSHFERHLSLAEDLAALGRAANRMADHAGPSVGRQRRRIGRIVAVAACLALVAGGIYYAGLSHVEFMPPVTSAPEAPRLVVSDRPAVPLGELMVRPVDERQVRIENAPDCVAVHVESSNPRVHIVWLYGSCTSPTSETKQ